MKGFHIPQEGHVVNILPPISLNGGKTSDYFSMENYSHVDIIIQLGAAVGATTITVFEAADFTPSSETAIAFDVFKEETAAGDTLGAKVAVTAAGFASVSDGTANTMYVISIDADQLTDGKPCLAVKFSNPGAQLGSAVAVLSGARYPGDQSPTAIA